MGKTNFIFMTDFKGRDILSTRDFSLQEIEQILEIAEKMWPVAAKDEVAGARMSELLKGKVLAALFYEPSTRTRLSFETAMQRLGGKVVSVTGMESSSLVKGETLHDTARVIENFADVIAVRHPKAGSALEMAEAIPVPVINAGDGPNQHPTQSLLDLFTIKKEQGKIDGLTIAMIGDLKFGRTVHSLCYLLAHYKVQLVLVAPDGLKMPQDITDHLKKNKIQYRETESLDQGLKESQVIYMTRIQQERFETPEEYKKYKGVYVLTAGQIENYDRKKTIMHPLPRVDEVARDVDNLPGAAYFRQVQNGVAVRMALLAMVLGKA